MKLYKLGWDAGASVASRAEYGSLLHRSQGLEGWLLTDGTRSALDQGGRLRRRPRHEPVEIDDEAWRAARARIVYGWSAAISDPPPDAVLDEVTLWLYARPEAQIEYMGRGRFASGTRVVQEQELIGFDVAGGRRGYMFRVVKARVGESDDRSRQVREDFAKRAAWMNDPDARLVLSMGGGGYRLFAALSALKVIEKMLGGDRAKVDEVWGSSGGALLGYVFANGLDLSVIDRLGFELYHGKSKDLPGIHLRSLANLAAQLVGNWALGRAGSPELGAWVEAVDRMCPPREGGPRVPYYAMVSNTRWRHPVAFAEPQFISEHCRDMLIPCPSAKATAASMAVPFLFRPLRGLEGFEDDIWFDGSIVDENPVMLPFVKWMRDRKADPEGTPKRLKVMLINLNMRLSESSLLTALAPSLRIVAKTAEIVDLLLDSKTHALIRTLTEIEDVEIMTATLTVGRLNFITRRDIPTAIRCGRVIEGWRLDTYPQR
jgi:predicted acylesterase/phospholipase RssA